MHCYKIVTSAGNGLTWSSSCGRTSTLNKTQDCVSMNVCFVCRFHMFNANRQPETVSNAQTGDEEMFARPFDVRMPRVNPDF